MGEEHATTSAVDCEEIRGGFESHDTGMVEGNEEEPGAGAGAVDFSAVEDHV